MGVKTRYENILKSPEDECLYRGLVLENGMKVFLVSDKATDKSAACMDVAVGHMSDPTGLPGLAHFCEHMLFLGTEKYPIENYYAKFLAEHSGRSNAHTATDHTDYYFDVGPDHLKKALDVFSQFFICPLFTESATDREVNAIESEHSKNILNDFWRFSQLEKSTAKEDHAFNSFGTGNKLTLVDRPKEQNINIRDELLKFHSKWYSANIMCLTVIGRETLDELEEIVTELFSTVKSTDIKAPSWLDSPYGPEQLKKIMHVVPIKDVRNLHLAFPMKDLSEYYKSHPDSYISHLIGHEGPGSVLSLLRARGWSNGLVAGSRIDARGFSNFTIKMDLTEEGMNRTQEIITLLFQYINMLKKEGLQEAIFTETRDIYNLNFRFKDKEPPIGHVVQLAYNARTFPMEFVLKGPFLRDEWRPDLIMEEVVNKINPDNMRIAIVAQRFKPMADSKEEWYETEYTIDDIAEEKLQAWRNAGFCENLALPPPNEFIPTDFSILPPDPEAKPFPTIIHDTMLSRVWFKQDDKFLTPKSSIRIQLTSPFAYMDPVSCDQSVLFVQLLEDALNDYVYAALLAGLAYKLMVTTNGLQLYIEGYSSKQYVLLAKIIDKIINFKIKPQRFEILKENYLRSLRNFELEQPRLHANYFMGVLMTETVWTKEELFACAEGMTVNQVEEFIPQLMSNIHLEFLIHGNLSKEQAMQCVSIVEETLKAKVTIRPLLPKQLMRSRQLQLADKSHFLYRLATSVHPSSCTLVYLQCGSLMTENNMRLELFNQIVCEPFFNVLRTKEQLGYIVFCNTRCSNTEQGLRIMIQSSRDPHYVEQRVEAFLEYMGECIRDMSDTEFERHREALAVRRLVKPKRLSALTDNYWEEIESQQYNFDRDNLEIAYLRTLTKQDIIKYYENVIQHAGPRRRKLSIHIVPTEESGKLLMPIEDGASMDNGKVAENLYPAPEIAVPAMPIEDVLAFQRSQALCAHAKPFLNIPPPNMGARSKL